MLNGIPKLNRREWVSLCSAALANAFQAPTALFQIHGLDHVALSVTDGQKTIDFYRPIFGQEIYLRPGAKADFRISQGGVSYLAINPTGDIAPGTIDHFSIGVKDSSDQIRTNPTRNTLHGHGG